MCLIAEYTHALRGRGPISTDRRLIPNAVLPRLIAALEAARQPAGRVAGRRAALTIARVFPGHRTCLLWIDQMAAALAAAPQGAIDKATSHLFGAWSSSPPSYLDATHIVQRLATDLDLMLVRARLMRLAGCTTRHLVCLKRGVS